jgi:phosphoserine phosphatase RsbU/P
VNPETPPPSGPAEQGKRPAILALPAFPPGPERRRRVLVVDDEPGMRYMTRRILEPQFEVEEAASGEEALNLLERAPFHIAIVDVRLPGLSGLDLLTTLKTCSPSIDVIVMTGSAVDVDEALEVSIRRKAFFFLRKPFPMSVLETLIERVAETQELEERLVAYARDLERSLESARKFQQRMLPPSPWESRGLLIASNYQASERLSGDFFDYWALPGGGTALLIADVMGHGPPSAMITGIVKSQVRSQASEIPQPGDVLQALEEELARIDLRGFMTAFLLFDRPEDGRIEYAGAGHLPALLWTPSGGRGPSPTGGAPEPSEGRVSGLFSQSLPINTGLPIRPRPTATLERTPGMRIFLYSDGYPEARDPGGACFDQEEGSEETAAIADQAFPNGEHSPFAQAARAALAAPSPTAGIEALESAWRRFVRGQVPDDDRAAVLAHFL